MLRLIVVTQILGRLKEEGAVFEATMGDIIIPGQPEPISKIMSQKKKKSRYHIYL